MGGAAAWALGMDMANPIGTMVRKAMLTGGGRGLLGAGLRRLFWNLGWHLLHKSFGVETWGWALTVRWDLAQSMAVADGGTARVGYQRAIVGFFAGGRRELAVVFVTGKFEAGLASEHASRTSPKTILPMMNRMTFPQHEIGIQIVNKYSMSWTENS